MDMSRTHPKFFNPRTGDRLVGRDQEEDDEEGDEKDEDKDEDDDADDSGYSE